MPVPLPYAAAAVRRLKSADPVLARIIAAVGPCRARAHEQDVFEALVQSISYQQLNGKAAATIHGRVVAALKGEVTPRRLLATPDKALRGAGLSRNKLASMKDLAKKCLSGEVPRRNILESLPDQDVIEKLAQVRGVGVWTAQMFLMFRLGRPDVLPSADFGIRKAFGLHFRKSPRLPPPEAVERHGRLWAPYRTVACWYLWRSLDA